MSEKSRQLDADLYRRFHAGETQSAMGRELGVGQARVWQRIERHRKRIREATNMRRWSNVTSTPVDVFEETERFRGIIVESVLGEQ